MDFNFNAVRITLRVFASCNISALTFHLPFGRLISRIVSCLSALLLLGMLPCSAAHAVGDAAKGRYEFVRVCEHCHGTPRPGKAGAFEDFDISANKLSVYASDASAITKAANEGYRIPVGNSNDEYLPGTSTNIPMGTWAGEAPNRLGIGTKPTQFAIDIAAYFATLFDAPNAPVIGTVISGNAQASVSFAAPKSDLTITSYTVTANPGGITATGTASPITVSGLSNGTPYTFTVTATSNAGTSRPSSSSNSITLSAPVAPVARPSAPSTVPAVAPAVAATSIVIPAKTPISIPPVAPVAQSKPIATQPAQIAVAKTISAPPAQPITTQPAPTTSATSANNITPIKVMPSSTPSAPVVPANPIAIQPAPTTVFASAAITAVNNVAPARTASPANSVAQASAVKAPIIKYVRAGNADAKIYFDIPSSGAAITGYTVTALANGAATGIKATGTKSPITVPGLTNGSEYSFTLTANSSSGSSAASAPSNPITPLRLLGD